MKAAVLTISDSTYSKKREDVSGNKILKYLKTIDFEYIAYKILPDDKEKIVNELSACIQKSFDVIITTGGTGITKRDITPESTKPLLDKELTGIEFAFFQIGSTKTKRAYLSRISAGTAGKTFILNLPGSPHAIDDYMPLALELIPHIYDLLNGKTEHHYEK